jgi:HEAT repeat protein
MRVVTCLGIVAVLAAVPALGQAPGDLVKQLKSPDAKTRRLAAESLGKQKMTTAIPALAELLKDEFAVREAAAGALVRMGPKAVPALAAALKFPDEISRLAALRALRILGPDAREALPALIAALKDKSVDVRIHAAHTLGQLQAGAKDALPALFEAAKDTGNVGEVLRPNLPSSVTETAIEAALDIDGQCAAALAKAALPALIEALKSKDGAVLQAAGYALQKLGPHAQPAVPALVQAHQRAKGFAQDALSQALIAVGGDGLERIAQMVKDTKAPLDKRRKVISELGYARKPTDKVASILVEALRDPEPEIRAVAVLALTVIGPQGKAAIPALVELLGDVKMDEAAAKHRIGATKIVAEALTRMGPEAVSALAEVLKDDNKKPFARWQAAGALAMLGRKAKSALPVLEAALKDDNLAVAVESACAYVRAGGAVDTILPVLAEGLQHKAAFVLWHTADAIERIGIKAKEAVPGLVPLLQHEVVEIRIKAAEAICQMGADAKPAVPALAQLLKQKDPRQQYQVARALERLGPDALEALPVLIERLKDTQAKGIQPILVTIGNIGPEAKAAVPALIAILKQKETSFHGDAITALGRIGPDAHAAVPKLLENLNDPSEYTRASAARALGGIGPKAKAAVPPLKKLLEDERKMVCVWAAYALARISGDSKSHVALLVEWWKSDLEAGRPFADSPSHDIAQALEMLGSEAGPARELLLEALLNEKTPPGTHWHVARALGQLREDAGLIVPKLMALTERKADSYARITHCVHAAEALGMFGPPAKAAIPRLRQLAQDEETEIAEAAVRALEKIEGK